MPAELLAEFSRDFARQPAMMELFEELFGPYPFGEYAVVVADEELDVPVEAQGLSIFGANHVDGRARVRSGWSRTSWPTSGSATA